MYLLIPHVPLMWSKRLFTTLVCSLLLCMPLRVSAMQAHEVVEAAADQVITVLEQQAEATGNNPDHRVYKLIETRVLPYFDFDRMSYFILGNFWKNATNEQRQRFIDAFRQLLLNTYITAFYEYSPEDKIVLLPTRVASNPDLAIVPTKVHSKAYGSVSVAYRMYRTDEVWRIFDVIIDGVSLVANYRASFSGQIRKGGMDGLLQSIAEHNKSALSETRNTVK